MFAKGKVEDKYTFGKDLGSGNYSVVKYATSKETGKAVAIKVINKSSLGDEGGAMVEKEIKIMLKLNHPNIVKLHEAYEVSDKYYLVLDLVSGGEMFDKIVALQHYSEAVAARLLRQMVGALDHVHSHNIVHRDLKPENLLLVDDSDGSPVLVADFGLAEYVTQPLSKPVGTPGYVAPEVVECLDRTWAYGIEVDMWAVGVILYIMLSGSPPFYSQDDDEVFDQILAGDFDFPKSMWKNVSEEAVDLVKKLMTVDPKKRLTARQTLEHPWLAGAAKSAELAAAKEELARFNAKRKWRGTIQAVMAANRLSRISKLKTNTLKAKGSLIVH